MPHGRLGAGATRPRAIYRRGRTLGLSSLPARERIPQAPRHVLIAAPIGLEGACRLRYLGVAIPPPQSRNIVTTPSMAQRARFTTPIVRVAVRAPP